MCHIFPCNILVTWDLGRILVIFTSCLACQVWGEPWELVNMFVEFVSIGDPSRRMFDDCAGMHEYLLCTGIVVVPASDPRDLFVERVTMSTVQSTGLVWVGLVK
jgi:hypothetical protein